MISGKDVVCREFILQNERSSDHFPAAFDVDALCGLVLQALAAEREDLIRTDRALGDGPAAGELLIVDVEDVGGEAAGGHAEISKRWLTPGVAAGFWSDVVWVSIVAPFSWRANWPMRRPRSRTFPRRRR